MSNAIGPKCESNPSSRICNLRAVPLGYAANNANWISNRGRISDVFKSLAIEFFGMRYHQLLVGQYVLNSLGERGAKRDMGQRGTAEFLEF